MVLSDDRVARTLHANINFVNGLNFYLILLN